MNKNINRQKSVGKSALDLLQQLHARGNPTFTLNDAAIIYAKNKPATTKILKSLVESGFIHRIKAGLYLLLAMGQETAQKSSWPLIAKALAGDEEYYISYYSAMRLHGMTTHASLSVTINMHKHHRNYNVDNINYRFVYMKAENFWGRTEVWINKQQKAWLSDIERTILDCFDRPELCGGIVEITRGIWSVQRSIDWQKLAEYAVNYHSKAAVKRLGYILQKINLASAVQSDLQKMVSSNMGKPWLEPSSLKQGTLDKMWKIKVNLDIEELIASVWG